MPLGDASDPLRHLTDPAARTESILGQPFSNPASALDWLSPSHIVNEFVKEAAGYDVFGEAATVFGGDWKAVWEIAGAYRNLASALQDIAVNISHGNVHADAEWDGNAADAAFMYFAELSSAVSSQQISLNELAAQYETAAEGVYRLSEVFSGMMKDIWDYALIGIAAASIGTATIQTGVGFVTGWGVAAYEAYKIASIARSAKEVIAAATALIGGTVGTIQALSAGSGTLAKFPLPAEGYRYPGHPA